MSGEYCGHEGCVCPDPVWPTAVIHNSDEVDQLPSLSVVQFRGPGLRGRDRLVWQLDQEWFSAGDAESFPTSYFPPDAFPAVVLWVPESTAEPVF
jgi:hypothetical protein